MQSTSPSEAELVEAILASVGLAASGVQFLAAGATSRVWYAHTQDGAVVIRLGDPAPQKAARFDADVGVRQRLVRIDRHVAKPFASGRWQPVTAGEDTGVLWCIDRFIAGETAPRGAIPELVCRELGALLSRQHELPVAGYGLLEDRRDMLSGQAPDAVSGLLTRLQDPWPFSMLPLENHPIAQAAPDLLVPLAGLQDCLRGVVREGDQCLSHTDLHERQMRIAEGHLAGLLDFGDATIGPRAWDIASFAYFHGWRLARAVLSGYSADEELRRVILEDAKAFAILIALHHASRSVSLQRPQRMRDAVRFLQDALTEARRAPPAPRPQSPR